MGPLEIAFKNEHLSVSRLKLFEQCELAFFFKYVSKGDVEPRGVAADFGTCLHAALELLYKWIVAEEYAGLFPVEMLVAHYKEAWQASQLVGVALFQEGLTILRTYAKSHPTVDHLDILDVEREFNIDVEGFTMNGYIDRVDKVADDHIVIVDYKSNRMLFTRSELDTDVQMSIYGLAARRLYPWAKRVTFRFDMLRHDTAQPTERTTKEIDDAAGYVASLGKRSEAPRRADEWRPTLNANCSYCDHRRRCPLYAKVLAGGYEVTKVQNLSDFGEVAATRETLHQLAKVLYAKKGELDDLLKARLAQEGEFDAGGYHYRMISGGTTKRYEPSAVIRAFGEVGLPPETVAARVLTVDVDAVERLRVEVIQGMDRPKALILNATLEGVAQVTPNAQRLDSRALKTAKKVRENDLAKEAEVVAKEAKKRDKKAKESPAP